MGKRKILGSVVLLGGIVMLFMSHYIQTQVDEGRGKISKAEKSINQGNSLFSLTPVTKEIGKGLSKSAEKKLQKYKDQADDYERLADQLQAGGWIAIVLGTVLIVWPEKRKSKK